MNIIKLLYWMVHLLIYILHIINGQDDCGQTEFTENTGTISWVLNLFKFHGPKKLPGPESNFYQIIASQLLLFQWYFFILSQNLKTNPKLTWFSSKLSKWSKLCLSYCCRSWSWCNFNFYCIGYWGWCTVSMGFSCN